MAKLAPRLCCLDLDTFFVSVERLFDPSLEGKPVVVGGRPGQRGVVTAASYEVRVFGVRSGMSMTEAVRLAPNAIFLPTRHGCYSTYSRQVKELLESACPVVQTASIDEFYLDFSGCERLFHQPTDSSPDETIRRSVVEATALIRSRLGLPSSAGIATCKQVAKIASGLAKPAGVLLVAAGEEAAFLAPLPVGKYPGIGPVAQAKLLKAGITTLGQLAETPLFTLEQIFGRWAEGVRRGARGFGTIELGRDRPAFREHDPIGSDVGSISNERTFNRDVSDRRVIESMLCGLCERVCWRARKRGVKGRTITLKLRYADFKTITRSRTTAPTASELELFPVIKELLAKAYTRRLPIRLLGIGLSNLGCFDQQLELFRPPDDSIHRAVDAIRAKYGFAMVGMAGARRIKKKR